MVESPKYIVFFTSLNQYDFLINFLRLVEFQDRSDFMSARIPKQAFCCLLFLNNSYQILQMHRLLDRCVWPIRYVTLEPRHIIQNINTVAKLIERSQKCRFELLLRHVFCSFTFLSCIAKSLFRPSSLMKEQLYESHTESQMWKRSIKN